MDTHETSKEREATQQEGKLNQDEIDFIKESLEQRANQPLIDNCPMMEAYQEQLKEEAEAIIEKLKGRPDVTIKHNLA